MGLKLSPLQPNILKGLTGQQKRRHITQGPWFQATEADTSQEGNLFMNITSQVVVKNVPVNVGDIRNSGLIPGSERFPGIGRGNPLQCSCLENPMDRGAWWATVYGVTKSWT